LNPAVDIHFAYIVLIINTHTYNTYPRAAHTQHCPTKTVQHIFIKMMKIDGFYGVL